jgi:hypothetical protein
MVTRRRMLMMPPAAAAAALTSGAREAEARRRDPATAPEPVHRGPWIRAPYDTYVRNRWSRGTRSCR